MRFQRLGILLCSAVVLGLQPSRPPASSYMEVHDWPAAATSVAGTPAAWNFGQVVAVATDTAGNILVLHRGAHPLMVFDRDGAFIRSWGHGLFSDGKVAAIAAGDRTPGGSGYTAVYGPAGCHACGAHSIRVDVGGNIWVVDAPAHVVYKLDLHGQVLMQLGTKGVSGTGRDTFNLPTDVAFASNGDLYVGDGYGNARVVKFSAAGDYQLEWGTRGTGPGEFGLPHGVVVDTEGRVYVVDRDNQRIQRFDADGTFLDEWPDLPGVQTLFMADGTRIWAGDTLRDLEGEALAHLPAGAGGHGMTVSDGEVFVAQLNGTIQKFVPRR